MKRPGQSRFYYSCKLVSIVVAEMSCWLRLGRSTVRAQESRLCKGSLDWKKGGYVLESTHLSVSVNLRLRLGLTAKSSRYGKEVPCT